MFWSVNNADRDWLAIFAEWEALRDLRWSAQLGLCYERVHFSSTR